MPSAPRTEGPRHMAGRPHRSVGSPHSGAAVAATASIELEAPVAAPVARVHRSRLALAVAVTLAALPVLVLDNFPATAATSERVDASATGPVFDRPLRTRESTSTEAPSTTAAPTTTEAPTTTVAPTTTTTRPVVRVAPATTAPPTTEAPLAASSGAHGDPNDPASWDRMAECESGGNWAANTGNGYYGGLQFSLPTWQHYGGTGYPHQASKATQIEIGKRLQASEGWDAWPSCARELGYS